MKKLVNWLLPLIFILTLTSKTFAFIDVGVAGGVSMANQNISQSGVTYSPATKSWLSYGVLGNIMFPGSVGLLIGFLYTELGSHQNISVGSGSFTSSLDEKAPYYQIPVALEYWLAGILGVGAGFYYGTSAGNVSDNGTQTFLGTTTSFSTSNSFSSVNYSGTDYGLIGVIDSHIPLGTSFFFSAKGIYEYGLQNYSTQSSATIKNSSILVLGSLGWRFL